MPQFKTSIPECMPLNLLVGRFSTFGRMLNDSGKEMTFRGTDVYEWLPGGHFLLHRWDVDMPEGKRQGIEVIGCAENEEAFTARSYDDLGNESVMKVSVAGNSINFANEVMRFTGKLVDRGEAIHGVWELKAGASAEWSPWMEVTLTRLDAEIC